MVNGLTSEKSTAANDKVRQTSIDRVTPRSENAKMPDVPDKISQILEHICSRSKIWRARTRFASSNPEGDSLTRILCIITRLVRQVPLLLAALQLQENRFIRNFIKTYYATSYTAIRSSPYSQTSSDGVELQNIHKATLTGKLQKRIGISIQGTNLLHSGRTDISLGIGEATERCSRVYSMCIISHS